MVGILPRDTEYSARIVVTADAEHPCGHLIQPKGFVHVVKECRRYNQIIFNHDDFLVIAQDLTNPVDDIF
jgi:hypothetical protein